MGLNLQPLTDGVQDDGQSVWHAVLIGLLAALRLPFVVPLVGMLKQDQRHAAQVRPKLDQWQDHPRFERLNEMSDRRRERITERVHRMTADLDFKLNEGVGWRSAVILGWAGMRGAITVAAALTIPLGTARRSEMVLIAYLVAAFTLLAQGLTLPAVIRAGEGDRQLCRGLGLEQRDLFDDFYGVGLAEIDRMVVTLQDEKEQDILARVREDLVSERDSLGERADLDARDERGDYCRLRLEVVAAQRVALNAWDDRGTFGSQAISGAVRMLDRDEVRLTSFDDT